MKKAITKSLVSILASAMIITTLPVNMLTTAAAQCEETVNSVESVSGADVMKEDISCSEEVLLPVYHATNGTFGDRDGFSWSYDESTATMTVTGEDSGLTDIGNYIPDDTKIIIFRECVVNGSMERLLAWQEEIESVAFYNCDTRNVTDMSGMFYDCGNLRSVDLSGMDASNATDIHDIFRYCSNLQSVNLNGFDTGNVTDMSAMFYYCNNLSSVDVNGFDTKNVTDMSAMFGECDNLSSVDVSGFDTKNVTNMSYMFYECNNLSSVDVSGFDTGNVTDMSSMFEQCNSLSNVDVSGFDTKNVTNMSRMFYECNDLRSLDLSGMDASNVTDISYMFFCCDSLRSVDLSGMDISNITDMSGMFCGFHNLRNVDLSGMNASNVTDMSGMFSSCNNLNSVDLSDMDVSKVTDISYMFSGCDSLRSVDLSGMDASNVTDISYMFYCCGSLNSVDLSDMIVSNVTNMSEMFRGCSNLSSVDFSSFDTRNATDMSSMFHGCNSLSSVDLSNFDTRNATDMSSMFHGCSSLSSVDLSNFDTRNVTDMSSMFHGCNSLSSVDLSSFDTTEVVESLYDMLFDCNLATIKTPKAMADGQQILLQYGYLDSNGEYISLITPTHCNKVLTKDTREYFGDALLEESGTDWFASVVSYPIEITGDANTEYSTYNSFSAETPQVVTFTDYKNCMSVAYLDGQYLKIQRYGSDMSLVKQLKIPKSYSLWGNITCDKEGYYYVVWGQNDPEVKNCVTISVKKYDYQGNFVAECAYKGYDTWDDCWGTRYAFNAGNCSLTINNGVLAVNYARQMYNGHQSNYIIYVDCATMTALEGLDAYCSHSFDQRVITLSDGGYLAVNHGDVRGFKITKIDADRRGGRKICNFHFREGSNRAYGYNETYAQLGGIVETDNAYIFCGSSERTLSVEVAPTDTWYCGYSEARDLFVQFYDKNLECRVGGIPRRATGIKPDADSVYTELHLDGSEVDYGVVWLTDYEDTHFAVNPKIVSIGDGNVVVMWEKRAYATYSNEGTYYAVLDEDGNVVKQPALLEGILLTGHIDPIYHKGKIYWTTSDENGDYIHALNPWMYSIKYELNGGKNHPANPVEYNEQTETVLLKNPTRTGYTFAGWYSDSKYKKKVTQIKKGSTEYKTLYAKWMPNKYTIKFDGNGATDGEMNSLTNRKYGTSYKLTANAYKKKGYKFVGWNTKTDGKGTKYTAGASVKSLVPADGGTITLYAQWKKETYKITYKLNGGTNSKSNPTKYDVDTKDILLKAPAKKGYIFKGWYKDSKYKTGVTKIAKGSTKKITLYAKWVKETYRVTYKLNGGKNNKSNPVSYTVIDAITLKKPTRTGYTFVGWYKDSKYKKKVTQIKKGSTGKITLYAKWTPNKYTIKFDGNGATSGKMNSLTNRKYGTSYKLTANAYKKKGYKFVGWNTKKNGKGKSYKNKASVKNLIAVEGKTVTLYAQWK